MTQTQIAPLTIALVVVTAGTLLLTAAAITPPPLIAAVPATPLPLATVRATLQRDDQLVALAQAEISTAPTPPAVIDLARLTYAPGNGGTSHAPPGTLLLMVESGVLTVQRDQAGPIVHTPQAMQGMTSDLPLHAGESLLIPMTTVVSLLNHGPEPVVALAAGIFPSSAVESGRGRTGSARWHEEWSPGANVAPLAGGWLVDAVPGAAALALQRLILQPGGDMPLTAAGPTVLAVETGELSLAAHGGLLWRQSTQGPETWLSPKSTTTLLPGDAALMQVGAQLTLRNSGSGPLLLLMLSVTPTSMIAT